MRPARLHGTIRDVDIVEFLEARIDEEEAELRHVDIEELQAPASLGSKLLAECVQKRDILADWKRAAAAEGINDPADAQGTVAMARRSMLGILAAGYVGHPDFDPEWGTAVD